MVMSLHGFPFLVTILKNAMLEIPRSMEESGGFVWRTSRPAVPEDFISSFDAGLCGRCLSWFSCVRCLSTVLRLRWDSVFGYHVFTTDIHDLALLAPVQFGRASALSVILTVICLGVWYMQKKYTGGRI